jgi:hypothetical protein
VAIDGAAKRAAEASVPVAPPPTVVSPKAVAPPPDMPANERAPLALTKSTARSSSARPARRRAPMARPTDVAAKTTSPNVQAPPDRIWDEQ